MTAITHSSRLRTAVVGGGPAGSIAALCLRKLGREVEVFEKARFPRYRVGESLLPGTLSILQRLGVLDRIEAAGFVKKRAATFLWGADREPWTFSFATPKTAPWVFDYGLQVNRDQFDQILLDAARDAGAVVHEECEVTGVDVGEPGGPLAEISYSHAGGSKQESYGAVIDATGTRGIVAQEHKLRRWDPYFRNIALWSYFRGGKRFSGDLEGNIFSVTFDEGWIWIIPLKDDLYSVGVVTGVESSEEIQRFGKEAFYQRSLAQCSTAADILSGADRTADVRATKEWSYDAEALSVGRAFLCGDSACFVDPLFSQGVHLAAYSGMLAAAAIDRIAAKPAETESVHAWYDRSYRAAYSRYHKFLCAFYSHNDQPNSRFWSSRKLAGRDDERIQGAEWVAALTGQGSPNGGGPLEGGAELLASLWRHSAADLDEGLDEQELALRRLRWANGILKDLKRACSISWTRESVDVVESFAVDRESFKLERKSYIADAYGRAMTGYPITATQQEVLTRLIAEPLRYNDLVDRLGDAQGYASPLHMVMRLVEDGLLEVTLKNGEPYRMPQVLRFAGVGGDDEFS